MDRFNIRCFVTLLICLSQACLPVSGQCDRISLSDKRRGSYSVKMSIPISETIDKWDMDITFSSPLVSMEVWNAKWSTDGNTVYHFTSHSDKQLTAGTVFNSVELIVFYPPSDKAPDIVSALFNGKNICSDD